MRVASFVFLLLVGLPGVAATHEPCPPVDCPLLIPDPPTSILRGNLELTHLEVEAEIVDGIGVTRIAFTLENPGNLTDDVTVTLPLHGPLMSLNLTLEDRTIEGRVQELSAARAEYTEAQQQGRSAAILEEASADRVRLSVNLPANGTAILRMAYAEHIPLAAGSYVYRVGLSNLGLVPPTAELRVSISDKAGIEGLTFPGISLQSRSPGVAAFEGALPSGKDLLAVWHAPDGEMRSSLVLGQPAGQNGVAVATICSGNLPVMVRDVVFVLDTSGSMRGTKIAEAKEALRVELARLSPADRYDVVQFSSHTTAFEGQLVAPTSTRVSEHRQTLADTVADGGTDIDGGLQEALRILATGSGEIPMVVFLTDGLPSAGITDHDTIIERFQNANTREAVIQVVPIGLDADLTFLADLALRSGGVFVPMGGSDPLLGDRLDRVLDLVAHPQLYGIEIEAQGYEVLLDAPGVAYEDGCLHAYLKGDFPASGEVVLQLSAKDTDGPVAASLRFAMATASIHEAVPSLAGRATIAHLLSQQRVEDLDLKADIIAQAIELRQLSPYTAWIVVDPTPVSAPAADADRQEAYGTGSAASPAMQYSNAGGATASYSYTSASSGTYSAPGRLQDSWAAEGKASSSGDSTQTPGLGMAVFAGLLVLAAVAARRTRRLL